MIEKIFFLLDLLEQSHELQPHFDKILKLCNKDYSGLDLEKLESNVNIYSMRLNRSDRLLYTLVGDKIFVLELIKNHDYQKSRFLNHSHLLKNLVAYLKSHGHDVADDIHFNMAFTKVDTPSELADAPIAKTLELIPVMKHDKKLIQFNKAQQQVMFFNDSTVVTGGAGSGKTCIAESKIKAFLSELRLGNHTEQSLVLFTTESPGLIHYQHHQLKQDASFGEVLDKHCQFSNYREAILPICQSLKKTPLLDEFDYFKNWFEKKYQRYPFTTEFVWRELRNASGYEKNYYIEEIGNKNSQISDKHLRVDFFNILENYLSSLDKLGLFSTTLEKLDSSTDPVFDMILVDEAQDLSTAQLRNLTLLAHNHHIVYFLGEHQVIYDSISKFHFLEYLFYKELKAPLKCMHLPSCYRNPPPILKMINKIIEIKCQLTGGLLDKHESSILELAPEHQTSAGYVQWLNPDDEHLRAIIQAYIDNPHFAVIVEKETDIGEAQAFVGCPPEQIFTKASCKGFEFRYVMLWKPLQNEKFRQLDKRIGEIEVEAKVFHRAKTKTLDDGTINVFNQLITAFSRSTEMILMVEETKCHPLQNLIDLLYPLFQADQLAQPSIQPVESCVDDWISLVITFLKENQKKEAKNVYERHLSHLYPNFEGFCQEYGFHEVQAAHVDEEKSPVIKKVEENESPLLIEFEEALFNSRTKKDRVSLKIALNSLIEAKELDKALLSFFNLFRCGRSLHVALFDKFLIDPCYEQKRGKKSKHPISLIDWLFQEQHRKPFLVALASYSQVLMKFPFKACLEYLASQQQLNESLSAFNDLILIQFFLYEAYRKSDIPAAHFFCPEQALPVPFLLIEQGLGALIPNIIQHGIDISMLTPNGESLVHAAFRTKQLDLLALFHQLDINLDMPDDQGFSLAHYIAKSGSVEDFISLASYPIAWTKGTLSPLHLAIQYNCLPFINALFDLQILSKEQIVQDNFLDFAFHLNQINVLEFFLTQAVDFYQVDKIRKIPYLFRIVDTKHLTLLEQCQQLGMNLHHQSLCQWNLAHYATHKNSIHFLDWLWEQDSLKSLFKQEDVSGMLPILEIGAHHDLVLLEWFRQKGADAGFHTDLYFSLAQQAIRHQNQPLLDWLVEQGLCLESCNEQGQNLLHLAVQGQSPTIVNFLLEKNVSIRKRDHQHKCPFLLAAEYGSVEILQQLFLIDGNLDQKDINNNNLAHIAVLFSNINVVKFLLDKPHTKVLFLGTNKHGISPIYQSILQDRIEIIQLIYAAKLFDFNQPILDGEYPIQVAIKYSSHKFIKKSTALQIKLDLPQYGCGGLLFEAIKLKHSSVFMGLLQLGAPYLNRDITGCCLTDIAASMGHINILEILYNLTQLKAEEFRYLFVVRMDLIIKEAILNNQSNVIDWIAKTKKLYPLLLEFHHGKFFVTQSIYYGINQIIEAAKLGHYEVLHALNKHGVNIFKNNELDQDIVQIALSNKDIKLLSLCGQANYDFKTPLASGTYPIILAAESGNSLIVDFLILSNVDCNVIRLSDRSSPVLIAAQNGFLDILITLSEVANLKAINLQGENFLHLAILNHHPQIIKWAIDCADFKELMNTPDFNMGYSPLEVLLIQNNLDIARLLINANCQFNRSSRIERMLSDCSPEFLELFKTSSQLTLSLFANQPAENSSAICPSGP